MCLYVLHCYSKPQYLRLRACAIIGTFTLNNRKLVNVVCFDMHASTVVVFSSTVYDI